jgi:DNA invertase Pin-like site-specific DNA recombinase
LDLWVFSYVFQIRTYLQLPYHLLPSTTSIKGSKRVSKMTKKIAIYARVSTDKQTCENQLLELRIIAKRMGYEVVSEFIDNGISGSKGREGRPALDLMMKSATQRKFDMVMCWSIDRLGRSLQNLVEILNELQSMRIDLFFLQQGMDTSTPSGRMIFSVFGAIGEFERNLIRERVIAGQKRAIANGVKMGRPSKMNDGMRSAIKLLREKGMGIKQIAKQLQVGIGTVYSVI